MEIVILSIGEGLKIDERGNVIRTRVVTYKIGEYGPFTIEIPATEFNDTVVRERIEKEREKLRAIVQIR
jgi:hypothetical protein